LTSADAFKLAAGDLDTAVKLELWPEIGDHKAPRVRPKIERIAGLTAQGEARV